MAGSSGSPLHGVMLILMLVFVLILACRAIGLFPLNAIGLRPLSPPIAVPLVNRKFRPGVKSGVQA